ncbi:hypothetical protein CHS0354_030129 [Potamilus streckersoni]|uniref:Copper transport protein n=1 Tax=Potamilus streckersoni TaxID=2493646 RepID=A0AAE0STP1_9BIVA|nr:hypothetical protein CHS0354_030129 [Potamilus streckersoni]
MDHSARHHDEHARFFHSELNSTILFPTWVLETRAGVFVTCLGMFVLAVCYQGTKWFREYLHLNFRDKRPTMKSKEHVLQMLLYVAEFLLSYISMLIIMSYNVWIFSIAILSFGVGYFFFGWYKVHIIKIRSRCDNEVCTSNDSSGFKSSHCLEPKQGTVQELCPLNRDESNCDPNQCEGCDFDYTKETDILT